jgi:threonine/homoserine/homoserine lactone efflux protein
MPAGQLWIIFSLSLLMSLSGALMPGPMLTYTISRTLRTSRRGWLTGARVVGGHAAVEALLVFALVLGVVGFLQAPLAVKSIAAVGAALLIYMGVSLLLETARGRGIELAGEASPAVSAGGSHGGPSQAGKASFATRLPPVFAGVLVSMSNPYWWIWWVTIGAAFLVRYDVTLQRWPALVAFFVGHELGDLGWFSAVSIALSLGRSRIPRAAATGIQAFCGAAIICFALYLGISTLLGR